MATQNQLSVRADFYTKVKAEETVYQWAIKNLLTLAFENGQCIESPEFCSVNTRETNWRLKIYPNGLKEREYISVYLELVTPSRVAAKVTLSILNHKTNQYFQHLNQVTFNHEFDGIQRPNDYYGYPTFCSHEDFMKADQGENSEVIVVCKIITQAKLKPTPSQCIVIGQKQESTVDLGNLLLIEKKFADFTLVSSDGVEFSAHKSILSVRSPGFCELLENANMIESQESRIKIPDIDSLTLTELVQFMYTGKCDNLNTMANKLLIASDKYELTSLKVEAAQALSRTISLENVLDIWITAHLHKAAELKKIARDFIKLNLKEIAKTSPATWEHFANHYPTFVIELICT